MTNSSSEPDTEKLRRAHRMLKSDPVTAVRELKNLAELGSRSAMIHLGLFYARSAVVPRQRPRDFGLELSQPDLVEAERWFQRAADTGLSAGYFYLGIIYIGQSRYEEALKPLRYIAAKEYPPALRLLGWMYFKGKGVPENLQKCEGYLERAAKKGNIRAKIMLAYILVHDVKHPPRMFWGAFMYAVGAVQVFYILFTEGQRSIKLL